MSGFSIWPNERRREERQFFIATIELIETAVHERIRARTGDLSMHGCYVDTVNTFPVGSNVRLTIIYNEETFTADGVVAHAKEKLGMGISFSSVDHKQKEILLKWLTSP